MQNKLTKISKNNDLLYYIDNGSEWFFFYGEQYHFTVIYNIYCIYTFTSMIVLNGNISIEPYLNHFFYIALKSLRSENHTPRFYLFNRSIRPYML